MSSKKSKPARKEKITSSLKQYKFFVLGIFILGVIGDIFLKSSSSDFVYFGFLALGIIAIFLYHISSKFFLSIALLVLIIMFLFFVTTGPTPKTEKAAVWFFLLFATGIIRQWKE